jgi:hypothetical protein
VGVAFQPPVNTPPLCPSVGWLLGGHERELIFVQCTSPCCARRPKTLATSSSGANAGGCIWTATGFEQHAGERARGSRGAACLLRL